MTQRPPAPPAVTRTPEQLERLAAQAFRQTIGRTVARWLSILFATVAAIVFASVVLEFRRVREAEAVLDGCRAAASQLPDPRDRIALIVATPACASVVDLARSR